MYLNFNATVFTIEELKAAVKKRYREFVHEDDLNGAHSDAIKAQQTLKQASEELVNLYVQTDGHERNLILTPEELSARKERSDKLGIVKAIFSALRKDNGAAEQDIKTAVRYQVTLRKLNIDSIALGSRIIGTLCGDLKLVFFEDSRNSPRIWKLAKKPHARSGVFLVDKLSDDDIIAICPEFHNFRIYESSRRSHVASETSDEY